MKLLEDFCRWLLEDGKSPKTIESYGNDVKHFQLYLMEKAPKESNPLSRFSFVRYKQDLLDGNYKPSTINKKLNSLKVYNDFLLSNNLVNETFIHLKRDRVQIASGSERMVQALNDDEVGTVLFYIQDDSKVSIRNRLIVYFLLYTAVRVSELVNIKMNDMDLLTQTLTVRGKGGKVREISLRHDLIDLMQQYRQGERQVSKFQDSPYLFVSQRSQKMHRDAVRSWLAIISEDIGINLHPHLFRRTCATLLLKRGVPIVTVSKILGHHSVDMTSQMYIQTSRQDKQDALDLL